MALVFDHLTTITSITGNASATNYTDALTGTLKERENASAIPWISYIELEYDHSVKNYCGTCTKCMDACPTQAIVAPYVVDSTKCISYLTIEYKGNQLPSHYTENSQNWIYGCDICQDVCPINARARQHAEPDFNDKEIFSNMRRSIWEDMTEEKFKEVFHDNPIKRTGYKGLMRNLEFSKKK